LRRFASALGFEVIPVSFEGIFGNVLTKGLVLKLVLKVDDLGSRRSLLGILNQTLVDKLMDDGMPAQ
jgi:hypothetical protein